MRILVTDDDPGILHLVTAILRRAGYQVDTASSGREALQKIDLFSYDALVLDLMMPGVSGLDVLARLKVLDPLLRFVIVMSASSERAIADAESLNVFASLRKPFEIDQLIATVGACIAARSEHDRPLREGPFPAAVSEASRRLNL